jgi:hypothetical protein
MPHTVNALFRITDLASTRVTPWGVKPSCKEKGIYIVALTDDPDSLDGAIASLPASHEAINNWMVECPALKVDYAPATLETIITRLSRYWLPNEVALYVGKTNAQGGLHGHIGEFYQHKLGRKSPHKGGQWIKSLSIISKLYVHYSSCPDPITAESAMIGHFCKKDPNGPFPFANLEWRVPEKRYLRQHRIL